MPPQSKTQSTAKPGTAKSAPTRAQIIYAPSKHLAGFTDFIREQGVVGLAVGFLLGGSVSRVVTSLVKDIINPVLSIALGSAESLARASLVVGDIQIMWGSFVSALIDFAIVAFVIYFGVKSMGLDRLDKKK